MEVAIVKNDVHFLMGKLNFKEERLRGLSLDLIYHFSVEEFDVSSKCNIEIYDIFILFHIVSADCVNHLCETRS